MAEGLAMQDVSRGAPKLCPTSLPLPALASPFGGTSKEPCLDRMSNSSISSTTDALGSPRSILTAPTCSSSLSSSVISSPMDTSTLPSWPSPTTPPPTYTAAPAPLFMGLPGNPTPSAAPAATSFNPSTWATAASDASSLPFPGNFLGTDPVLLSNALQAASAANAAAAAVAASQGLTMLPGVPQQPQVMSLDTLHPASLAAAAAAAASGTQLLMGPAVAAPTLAGTAANLGAMMGLVTPTLAPLSTASAAAAAAAPGEPSSPTQSAVARVKVLLHSGGKFHKDRETGCWVYRGGETRLVTVRPGCDYEDLIQDLDRGTTSCLDQVYQVKYELPGAPGMLVDVINDDDVENMWEEWQVHAMLFKRSSKFHIYIQIPGCQ